MLDLELNDKEAAQKGTSLCSLQQESKKLPFNNKLWREILYNVSQKASEKFNLVIESIAPFGFEILMDKGFLYKNLRRFYCYIGTNVMVSESKKIAIMEYFYDEIMRETSIRYNLFFSSVVLIITGATFIYLRDRNYKCESTDKLIDIQLRTVNKNILEDYSNYIITSLDGLIKKTDETRGYKNKITSRWRSYQLYIMQEQLYKHLLPEMLPHEKDLFNSVFKTANNMVNVFYEKNLADIQITPYEVKIFDELIMPRLGLICKAIYNEGKDLICAESMGYHHNDKLSIMMDKKIYIGTMLKIQDTYINYA